VNMPDYKKTTLKSLGPMRFRTLRDMRCGWGVIPAGTLVRVTEKMNGWTVLSTPCSCCGVVMSMSRVYPRDLERVE